MIRKSDLIKAQYTTGDVAKVFGVTVRSIILWDKKGKISFDRTPTDRRIISREDLITYLEKENLLYDDSIRSKRDVIYCRVSSHEQKQKGDLDRQVVAVMTYATDMNLQNPLILQEVGSGLNDNRKHVQKLLKMVVSGEVNRIFVHYRDRLTRFGFNYIETICNSLGVEIIVVADETKSKSAQEEMVEDMMALIASFSGKLYGMRGKAKKESIALIESIPDIEG